MLYGDLLHGPGVVMQGACNRSLHPGEDHGTPQNACYSTLAVSGFRVQGLGFRVEGRVFEG